MTTELCVCVCACVCFPPYVYVYCSNIQTVGIVFVMVGVGCVYIAGPVTLKTAVCADTHDTHCVRWCLSQLVYSCLCLVMY